MVEGVGLKLWEIPWNSTYPPTKFHIGIWDITGWRFLTWAWWAHWGGVGRKPSTVSMDDWRLVGWENGVDFIFRAMFLRNFCKYFWEFFGGGATGCTPLLRNISFTFPPPTYPPLKVGLMFFSLCPPPPMALKDEPHMRVEKVAGSGAFIRLHDWFKNLIYHFDRCVEFHLWAPKWILEPRRRWRIFGSVELCNISSRSSRWRTQIASNVWMAVLSLKKDDAGLQHTTCLNLNSNRCIAFCQLHVDGTRIDLACLQVFSTDDCQLDINQLFSLLNLWTLKV